MNDPLDLERVKAYCAKATAGPWLCGGPYPGVSVCIETFSGHSGNGGDVAPEPPVWEPVCIVDGRTKGEPNPQAVADGEFITNSRTDLPAAVEEIESLRAEVTSLSIELSTCRADNKHLRLVDGREDAEPVFLQNHELLQENRQFREAIAELRQQLRNEQERK